MNFLTNLLTSSAGSFVKDVGETVGKFVTTDKDRAELEKQLQEMQNTFLLQLDANTIQYEEEITKRLQADMQSDSWLAKNIRPLTLIFILVMYSLLSVSSGFDFKVTESYITLLGQWGMLIMSFYFGGRTVEKITSTIKGVSNGKNEG